MTTATVMGASPLAAAIGTGLLGMAVPQPKDLEARITAVAPGVIPTSITSINRVNSPVRVEHLRSEIDRVGLRFVTGADFSRILASPLPPPALARLEIPYDARYFSKQCAAKTELDFCYQYPCSHLPLIRHVIEGIGGELAELRTLTRDDPQAILYCEFLEHLYKPLVIRLNLEMEKQRKTPSALPPLNRFSFTTADPLPSIVSSLPIPPLSRCVTIAELREHPIRMMPDLREGLLPAFGVQYIPSTWSSPLDFTEGDLTDPNPRLRDSFNAQCIRQLDSQLKYNVPMKYGIEHIDFLDVNYIRTKSSDHHRLCIATIRKNDGTTIVQLFDSWGSYVYNPVAQRTDIIAFENLVEKWAEDKGFVFTSLLRPPSDVQMSFPEDTGWEGAGCCVFYARLFAYFTASGIPPEKMREKMRELGTDGRHEMIRRFGTLLVFPTAENISAFKRYLTSKGFF